MSIWFHLYETFKIDKSIQIENRWVVSRGQGAGEEWLTVMSMEFILGGNENVLKLDSSAGFTALWIYENVGGVVYELYLNFKKKIRMYTIM